MYSATKIRIYPTKAQEESLSKAFGCARWYWNNSLAETQKVYAETGKGLGQYALNARLPHSRKSFPGCPKPTARCCKACLCTCHAPS